MTKRKPRAAPMVVIRWCDASFSSDDHWQDGEQPKAPTKKSHICVTVGFLTHLDDDFAQVTQTLTTGQHAHVANIPRAMVESVDVLLPVSPLEE
jgi:hypothetical protein